MVQFYYKINLISTQGPLPAKVTGNLTFRQYRIPPCSLLDVGIGPRFQGLTLPRQQEMLPIVSHLSSVIPAGPCSRPHGPCLCYSEVTRGASEISGQLGHPWLGNQSLWYHRAIPSEILVCSLAAIREQVSWGPSSRISAESGKCLFSQTRLSSTDLVFWKQKTHFQQIRKHKLLAWIKKESGKKQGETIHVNTYL